MLKLSMPRHIEAQAALNATTQNLTVITGNTQKLALAAKERSLVPQQTFIATFVHSEAEPTQNQ